MNTPDYSSLEQRYADALVEIKRLRALLRTYGIDAAEIDPQPGHFNDNIESMDSHDAAGISKRSTPAEKTAFYLDLFAGRSDVYARRWESSQTGKHGYSPVCKNIWQPGLCGKPKAKCSECKNASYAPLTADVIAAHLQGIITAGIYPLLQDDTCRFLAIDFDDETWKADVSAVKAVCGEKGIPCAVEVSRSTNGAHLWFFFSEAVPASDARRLGAQVLTEAMQQQARMKFTSYDRMFPNQDTMPKGGFGNLIALPFQPAVARNGGSRRCYIFQRFKGYDTVKPITG